MYWDLGDIWIQETFCAVGEYHDVTLHVTMHLDKGGAGGRGEGWLFDRYVATAAVSALQAKIKNAIYFAAYATQCVYVCVCVCVCIMFALFLQWHAQTKNNSKRCIVLFHE